MMSVYILKRSRLNDDHDMWTSTMLLGNGSVTFRSRPISHRGDSLVQHKGFYYHESDIVRLQCR